MRSRPTSGLPSTKFDFAVDLKSAKRDVPPTLLPPGSAGDDSFEWDKPRHAG
jgi:hypothetical protein